MEKSKVEYTTRSSNRAPTRVDHADHQIGDGKGDQTDVGRHLEPLHRSMETLPGQHDQVEQVADHPEWSNDRDGKPVDHPIHPLHRGHVDIGRRHHPLQIPGNVGNEFAAVYLHGQIQAGFKSSCSELIMLISRAPQSEQIVSYFKIRKLCNRLFQLFPQIYSEQLYINHWFEMNPTASTTVWTAKPIKFTGYFETSNPIIVCAANQSISSA